MIPKALELRKGLMAANNTVSLRIVCILGNMLYFLTESSVRRINQTKMASLH
jgi:hypothetical protein